jgi:hypothetical protein
MDGAQMDDVLIRDKKWNVLTFINGGTSCVYQQAHRIYTFPRAPDQSAPAPMTVPVGRSVHRMASVFHLPVHPMLTNILPQSNFLPADL